MGHQLGGFGATEHRGAEINLQHLDLAFEGAGEFPEPLGDKQPASFPLRTVPQAG